MGHSRFAPSLAQSGISCFGPDDPIPSLAHVPLASCWPYHFGVKLLELIHYSESKPKSTWKNLEVKIFRSFGSDDYKRANSNVDEARFLSSGETQSSSSDSENLNSRRNKIHSKNPVETNNLPFKAPGQATPSSSSSSAGFYSYYKFDNRRGSLCPWLRFKYLRSIRQTYGKVMSKVWHLNSRYKWPILGPIRGNHENDYASQTWASSVPDSYDLGEKYGPAFPQLWVK
ncbi:hypothetical protein Fcan01_05831 [Folsomia candida]|uniref:Uncharacterized protein n=1 Tax=Folsomia candida TaxID=158441 RepID=A0A226ERN0_FOLCA|nr:hypothetical protein Fcan01_05831 [Folsomia candida]